MQRQRRSEVVAQRRGNGETFTNQARQYTLDEIHKLGDVQPHYVGRMDQKCSHCGAYFWAAECNFRNKYTSCCCEGKIKLPPIQPPPPYIKELLKGESEDGRIFYRKSRAFNTNVSFASVSLKEDQYITHSRGVPTLRICGSVYHIGAITRAQKNKQNSCSVFFPTTTNFL